MVYSAQPTLWSTKEFGKKRWRRKGWEIDGSGRCVDADAPTNRIGCFRIGVDLPATPIYDLSSDDSDAYKFDEDILEIEELGLNCTDATAVLMHIGIGDSF